MKKAVGQRQALLAMTIEAVALRGFGEFSLRHLASAAGLSTTAIFQNFSGKAELLEHALGLAIARDQVFHEDLLAQAAGFLTTHISFADFLARYIMMRPALAYARFASEIMIGLDDDIQCHGLLQQWHSHRMEFWTQVLAKLDARPGLARVVFQFVLMEEYYAYALHGECTYGMLLAETCRAISEEAFYGEATGLAQSHVSLSLATQPLSIRDWDNSANSPMREQLLDEALRIIESSGLEALNQRHLARNAGVSASAIAYYFKDMKSFRTQAIWRALVNGIPSQLDPERSGVEQPRDISEWLKTLDAMLEPGTDDRPAGFYIGFVRLTGQACLLSRHDPSLVALVSYLRALEGWGTYHVSRNIAPLAELIRREHAAAFGMWIKSEALMRRVNLAMPGTGFERLEFAASQIFPER
jgi:AcrR family transcriptional regulator